MKLVGSLVMGVGALMCITLFTVERAYAGENDRPIKCTLATSLLVGPESATTSSIAS